MTCRIRFDPVDTWIHGSDEARLVFVDDKLGAVVVRLGQSYGDLADSWHAEAAFNDFERLTDTTFPTLDAIERWLAGQLAS
jgi:hypothetical protein